MSALITLLLWASPDAGVAAIAVEGDLLEKASLNQEALKAIGAVTMEWKDKRGPTLVALRVMHLTDH